MGTNFYLIKKLPRDKKDRIIKLIEEDEYEKAKEEIPDPIHIGKRSAGWKFLWNAHEFEYFSPTKESLIEWLNSGDIVDEYGEKFTFDQFWNEELVFEGYDLEKYYNENPSTSYKYYESLTNIRIYKQNFNVDVNKHGEFYIDNLRFTCCTEFS